MPTQSSLSYRLRPFLVADSKLPTQPFWLPTQTATPAWAIYWYMMVYDMISKFHHDVMDIA
jgi:hypothetical protein